MQSRAVIRSLRFLPATRTSLFLPLARASTTTAGPADTAVHSQDPQGDDAEEAAKATAAEEKQRRERQPDIEIPPTTDNIPPFAPSPKLGSHEVGRPGDPSFQQKRRWSHAAAPGRSLLEDATCVGADGSPLVGGGDSAGGFGGQVKEEEEEYAAYYKGHKPSPLSEIEFVDTRKPINQAWDGGASGGEGGQGGDVGGHGGCGFAKSGGDVPGGKGERGSGLAAVPGSREDASRESAPGLRNACLMVFEFFVWHERWVGCNYVACSILLKDLDLDCLISELSESDRWANIMSRS